MKIRPLYFFFITILLAILICAILLLVYSEARLDRYVNLMNFQIITLVMGAVVVTATNIMNNIHIKVHSRNSEPETFETHPNELLNSGQTSNMTLTTTEKPQAKTQEDIRAEQIMSRYRDKPDLFLDAPEPPPPPPPQESNNGEKQKPIGRDEFDEAWNKRLKAKATQNLIHQLENGELAVVPTDDIMEGFNLESMKFKIVKRTQSTTQEQDGKDLGDGDDEVLAVNERGVD